MALSRDEIDEQIRTALGDPETWGRVPMLVRQRALFTLTEKLDGADAAGCVELATAWRLIDCCPDDDDDDDDDDDESK